MVDVLAAPQQAKADSSLRTLTAISVAHWVSHFHIFVLPMLFPYLKAQLGVGYIELGLAVTVFGLVSALTQAPDLGGRLLARVIDVETGAVLFDKNAHERLAPASLTKIVTLILALEHGGLDQWVDAVGHHDHRRHFAMVVAQRL